MATSSKVSVQSQVKIENIGVLTDLSNEATRALRFAVAFARAFDAGITLAHSYIPPSFAYAAPEVSLVYQAIGDMEQSLKKNLVDQAKAAFLHGIKFSTVLRVGGPKDLLEDLSGMDLIVVGTKGESGIEKTALGSTAETIFRSCAMPVLTVGPFCQLEAESPSFVKTILYATDFSYGAEVALPYALSFAQKFGAELSLVHAVDDHDVPFSFERAMASQEPLEKLRELAPGDRVDHIVGFGPASAVILDEARNRKTNLIVIGARGRGGFSSVVSHFGGGTAYEVAAKASCPVLTVRRP
jgi:nucleotide-binding universal stress UspA family protein